MRKNPTIQRALYVFARIVERTDAIVLPFDRYHRCGDVGYCLSVVIATGIGQSRCEEFNPERYTSGYEWGYTVGAMPIGKVEALAVEWTQKKARERRALADYRREHGYRAMPYERD